MSEGDDYRYEQSTEQTLNQGKSRELMDMIFLAPRSFKRHIRLTPIAGFAFSHTSPRRLFKGRGQGYRVRRVEAQRRTDDVEIVTGRIYRRSALVFGPLRVANHLVSCSKGFIGASHQRRQAQPA